MNDIDDIIIDEICNKYVTEDAIFKLKLRNGEEIDFTKDNLFKMIIADYPCGSISSHKLTIYDL